jgi:hypothetical protein
MRQYMVWVAIIAPGITDQQIFLDHLQDVVCGKLFGRNGLMTVASWLEVSGRTKKQTGKAGTQGKNFCYAPSKHFSYCTIHFMFVSFTVGNNLWKAYQEVSMRVAEHFCSELINPLKLGVSMCCPVSICVGVERGLFETISAHAR